MARAYGEADMTAQKCCYGSCVYSTSCQRRLVPFRSSRLDLGRREVVEVRLGPTQRGVAWRKATGVSGSLAGKNSRRDVVPNELGLEQHRDLASNEA